MTAKTERNALIVAAVLSGRKQGEVAAEFGISRARVNILFKRDRPAPIPRGRPRDLPDHIDFRYYAKLRRVLGPVEARKAVGI